VTFDTLHYPSADDITFDSLEYLFGPASAACAAPVPWVDIEADLPVPEKQAEAYQEKLALAQQDLRESIRQSQRLCILIGYMQGLLHEKDEQLKALPELRFQAGMAVARLLETERCKERIAELEASIEHHQQSFSLKAQEMLRATVGNISYDEAAASILMWLGFAGLCGVLLTLACGF
jgi:hypothetical protein